MKHTKKNILLVFVILFSSFAWAHTPPGAISHYRFVENKGQWDQRVLFRADYASGGFFLEKNAFTYSLLDPQALESFHSKSPEKSSRSNNKLKGHAFSVEYIGANPDVSVSGLIELPEYFNYYTGSDQSKWVSKARAYTTIFYKDIYPGIDLKVYTYNGALKYDLIVNPGSDPSVIKLKYKGADKVKLQKDGNLTVKTSVGDIVESSPYAYQVYGEEKRSVRCHFKLEDDEVLFALPDGFDKKEKLVIDPELIFSTYSGSRSNNFGYTATYDSEGFLYSGSTVFGTLYPTTLGAYDVSFNGGNTDITITKYDTTGRFMLYSTYVGGSRNELPHSLICNSNKELYVFGTTDSPDFPTTPGAFDNTFNNDMSVLNTANTRVFWMGLGMSYVYGCDIVLFRLSADGTTLKNSTYLGGSGNDGINTAARDSIYFTSTGGASWVDVDPASSDSLNYNYADEVRGEIDIDQNGNIYIATCTSSPDFPIVGGFQPTYGGGKLDGLVVKMDSELSSIIWSSFNGGKDLDAIYSLALDKSGNVYVAGGTTSENFPVTDSVVYDTYSGGRADGFVTYVNSQGNVRIKSTLWGSNEYDQNYFIELDFNNYVYLFGQTEAKGNYFIKDADFAIPNSGQFVSKLSPGLDTLVWSTVFGTGSGTPDISPTAFMVDICKKIYLSGWGGETNNMAYNNAGYTTGLPITSDAYQSSTDGSDFYLLVMEDDASALHYATFMGGDVSPEHVDGGTSRFDRKGKVYQSVCAGCSNNSDFPVKPNPGAWSVTNNSSCNNAVFKFDFKLPAIIADFEAPEIGCAPLYVKFKNNSLEQTATKYYWDFGDGNTSNDKEPTHIYTKAGTFTIKLKMLDNLTCNLEDSISKEIVILSDTTYNLPAKDICPGEYTQVGLMPNPTPGITYTWSPSNSLSNPFVSNPIAKPTLTTTYTLLISNGVCTDTIYQMVGVHPVSVSVVEDTIICSTDGAVRLQPEITGVATSFHWSNYPDFSDRLNADATNPVVNVVPLLPSNKYYFKATNIYGCSDTDTATVHISDYNVRLGGEKYVCYGDTVNLWATTSLLQNDTLRYRWEPKHEIDGPNDTSHVVARPSKTQYYKLFTENLYGCKYTDSVLVEVSPVNPANISAWAEKDTIFEGHSTILHVVPRGFLYRWSPGLALSDPASSDPVAAPPVTTDYNVSIRDQRANCRIDTTVRVVVIPVICDEPNIFVPNAFTPNSDGVNDRLFVRGAFIEKMHLVIYDRWGEKVFESWDQKDSWDGMYKGKKADPAVFVYYLEVECIGGKQYFKKGNISVLE